MEDELDGPLDLQPRVEALEIICIALASALAAEAPKAADHLEQSLERFLQVAGDARSAGRVRSTLRDLRSLR